MTRLRHAISAMLGLSTAAATCGTAQVGRLLVASFCGALNAARLSASRTLKCLTGMAASIEHPLSPLRGSPSSFTCPAIIVALKTNCRKNGSIRFKQMQGNICGTVIYGYHRFGDSAS